MLDLSGGGLWGELFFVVQGVGDFFAVLIVHDILSQIHRWYSINSLIVELICKQEYKISYLALG